MAPACTNTGTRSSAAAASCPETPSPDRRPRAVPRATSPSRSSRRSGGRGGSQDRRRLDLRLAAAKARGEEAIWQRIQERVTPEFCAAVDALLAVPKGDRRSEFNEFKQYPPEARPVAILAYLERNRRLRSIGTGNVDLVGLGQEVVAHLADLGRRYDVDDLKRFARGPEYCHRGR